MADVGTQPAPMGAGFTALVEAVETVESFAEFQRLIEERPELVDEAVVAELQELSGDPVIARWVERYLDLARGVHSDAAAAWSRFDEVRSRLRKRGRELEGAPKHIATAIREGRFDDAQTMAEEAFAYATDFGFPLLTLTLHEEMATAFFETSHGDRAANIDVTIEHRRACIPFAVDKENFAGLAMNLAVMWIARKNGDPAENFEEANNVLRAAISHLDQSNHSEQLAIIQTNLAHNLQVRERGERLENLREARDLCVQALKWRSLNRDPTNWAYTMINLGSIYDDLALLGEAELTDATEALHAVIDQADRIAIPWLIGHAHGSLGAIHRAAAERLARDERAIIGPGPRPAPSEVETAHLMAAEENLTAALDLVDPQLNRELYGRILNDLGEVLRDAGDEEGAIESSGRALDALGATVMPRQSQEAGSRLGDLLARRGQWDEAAAAYATAVEAHEFAFHARLQTADRVGEAKRMGNTARWAAFAQARAGDVEQAIITLENSRTRELRRRLGLDSENKVPDELQEAYRQAVRELSSTPMSPGSDAAARHLQEVLTAIRGHPGFADFATGTSWQEITAAVEPDWPLIYVDPTPHGTALLVVSDNSGEIIAEAIFLDRPTSHDVFMTLMFGSLDDPEEPKSYLLGITAPDKRLFPLALDEVLPRLGEGIARPLASYLAEAGFQNLTLVLCGPIGLAPVHAATWDSGDSPRCLLDEFNIRTTPSALVQATSLRRLRDWGNRETHLVAIANPDTQNSTDDLPGTDPEVEEIAGLVAPRSADTARRKNATSGFFHEQAPRATLLHLACHGRGGLFDPQAAGLRLADRWLSGSEIIVANLASRLSVLSACQTAVAAIAEVPDEVFSMSTMLLGAGSAGAIATLWSIDDAATALLMCRFYEEMLRDGRPPAEALRAAQLWLRDLTDDEEAAFLADHPSLEAYFRRRREAGQRPGYRGLSPDQIANSGGGRYSHPQYWAAFVVTGA